MQHHPLYGQTQFHHLLLNATATITVAAADLTKHTVAGSTQLLVDVVDAHPRVAVELSTLQRHLCALVDVHQEVGVRGFIHFHYHRIPGQEPGDVQLDAGLLEGLASGRFGRGLAAVRSFTLGQAVRGGTGTFGLDEEDLRSAVVGNKAAEARHFVQVEFEPAMAQK